MELYLCIIACFMLNLSNMQESNGVALHFKLPVLGKQAKVDRSTLLSLFQIAPKIQITYEGKM